MSINERETVGYTDDGEFISLPKRENHQVGQILNLSAQKSNKRNFFTGWQVAAVATIMLVAFMGVLYPQFTQEAEAYLSLGLNSGGVEMWVDKNDKVIDIKYHDAATTWGEQDLKGENVYKAVTLLASKAQHSGLLDEQQDKMFMLNHANLNENVPHHLDESKLKQSASKGLSTDYNGLMIMGRHDMNFINKAKEMGVTASQYYVMEQSTNAGHNITADQVKGHHISDVLTENGTTPEEVFQMEPHMNQNNSTMPRTHNDDNKIEDKSDEHSNPSNNGHNTMPNNQNNMNDMQGTEKQPTDKTEQTHDGQYMDSNDTPHQDYKGNMDVDKTDQTHNSQYMGSNDTMHQEYKDTMGNYR